MFTFAANAFASLFCLVSAVVEDNVPWPFRVLLVFIALGCGFAAAFQTPIVRRYAERNGNP